MKYLLQILSSIVYTLLVSSIFYFIVVLPIMFIVSLPWWAILLFILLLGGIIEGLKDVITVFVFMPYMWICKRNIISTGLATIILLATFIRYAYILFTFEEGTGFWYYAACVFACCEFLQLFWASLNVFTLCYTRDN